MIGIELPELPIIPDRQSKSKEVVVTVKFPRYLQPIVSAVFATRFYPDDKGAMAEKIKRNLRCTQAHIDIANKIVDSIELQLAKA